MVVPRDSIEVREVGPLDIKLDPDDVRAMSPRRTSEDLENLGKEARDELRRYDKPSPSPCTASCVYPVVEANV